MAGKVGYLSLRSRRPGPTITAWLLARCSSCCIEGVQSLDVTGPLEVFTAASRHQEARGLGPAYQMSTASPDGQPVTTSSGLRLIPDGALRAGQSADTVVVPGGNNGAPAPGLVALAARHSGPHPANRVGVHRRFRAGRGGAARRAAGHHALGVRQRAGPAVPGCPRRPGADPHPGRRRSPPRPASRRASTWRWPWSRRTSATEAALTVARYLVVYLRRPGGQAQYSAQLRAQAARREPLREVQQWISEHPSADLSVDRLAGRAGLSPRQFARAFTAETGITPGRHVAAVRLEAARRMLDDGRPGSSRSRGPAATATARPCAAPSSAPSACRRRLPRPVLSHPRPLPWSLT